MSKKFGAVSYSSLLGRPDIHLGSGTLQRRSKIWIAKKQDAKKQGHCYSKREEARLPLLFLSNNEPVFLHPAFCNPYFGPFFQGHKPTHVFKTRIVGAD